MEECSFWDFNKSHDGILVGVFESKEYDSGTRTYSKALVINKETGALLSVSPHGIFVKKYVKKMEDE